jgi:hypothetical protein
MINFKSLVIVGHMVCIPGQSYIVAAGMQGICRLSVHLPVKARTELLYDTVVKK